MSIATFAGILAQTQAAEFTLHILRGRCAARPDRSPFLADEAAALRGQAGINPRWFREIWALSGLPGSATPACGKRCFSALSLSNSQIPRFQKS